MGNLLQQSVNVGGFDHLQKLVRRIVFRSANGGRSVKKSDAFFLAKRHDFLLSEPFFPFIDEMVAVAEENLSLDAPMVVDEIRVEKVHRPPFPLRWKAAEKQHLRVLRQKRLERMKFHVRRASRHIFEVEE